MLTIRLQRRGRKNDPSFRVILVEAKRAAKTGNVNEILGFYDARSSNINLKADRIKYWISKSRLVGVKADYFTVSGKTLKTASMRYDNHTKLNGQVRPFISKITIIDELIRTEVTTLEMKNPSFQKLPDYIFNLNLLRR